MLSLIVAIAENNVIGKDNKLIWHISEDLKRFKSITSGSKMLMGRKTFESLPGVLPNRKHIILCNDAQLNIEDENVEVIDDISLLDKYINSAEENFIIGGAEGLSQEVRDKSNFVLSFGKMVFPHLFVRVMLIEQLYRVYTLQNGHPYHK